MNTFKSFIDSFASKELKKRIAAVVAVGFFVFVAAFTGGWVFLTRIHTVALEGTAKLDTGKDQLAEVKLDCGSIAAMKLKNYAAAEFEIPKGKTIELDADVVGLNTETCSVLLSLKNVPDELKTPQRLNARIILIRAPYWKMLFEER